MLFSKNKKIGNSKKVKKIKVILGLGNPGKQYSNNRHNFGFMVLDRIAERWGMNFTSAKGSFVYAYSQNASDSPENLDYEVYFCKPLCFMNSSGVAAKQILNFFDCSPLNLLVIYDDVDLPLGRIRLRKKGSDGGHKGIRSIINYLETTKFPRLRLGIGPQEKDVPSEVFVLSNFQKSELPTLNEVIDISISSIIDFVNNDISSVMNKYNRRNLSAKQGQGEIK